jgi:hypothetical protein
VGVQELAVGQQGPASFVAKAASQVLKVVPVGEAVELVADDRVADRGEMGAELVTAARSRCEGDERDGLVRSEDLEVGHRAPRVASVRGALEDDLEALGDSERSVDPPAREAHPAVDDREIALLDLSPLELSCEGASGLGRLDENDEAAGVAVEPVREGERAVRSRRTWMRLFSRQE